MLKESKMRLYQDQIKDKLKTISSTAQLFGSRVDDEKKGGDNKKRFKISTNRILVNKKLILFSMMVNLQKKAILL